MPDTWEYPWYASWDLAFHCVAISHIDPAFAKEQLLMMGYEWYQHANGQFPAYEWNFDDVNPPVQCWAAWRVYQIEFEQDGRRDDADFLKRNVPERMLNFSYWVNRKDASGRDVFGGGFLGHGQHRLFRPRQAAARWRPARAKRRHELDGAVLRSPCSNDRGRTRGDEPFYQNMAIKYFEHFLYIAHAMTNMDGDGDRSVGQ